MRYRESGTETYGDKVEEARGDREIWGLRQKEIRGQMEIG